MAASPEVGSDDSAPRARASIDVLRGTRLVRRPSRPEASSSLFHTLRRWKMPSESLGPAHAKKISGEMKASPSSPRGWARKGDNEVLGNGSSLRPPDSVGPEWIEKGPYRSATSTLTGASEPLATKTGSTRCPAGARIGLGEDQGRVFGRARGVECEDRNERARWLAPVRARGDV